MSLKEVLVCALIGWSFLSGLTPAAGDPLIVQYQEWFSEYAHIAEDLLALKRAINSNKTLTFNVELVGTLANATTELRTVDNATAATIQQADTIGEPCRQVVHELFNLFRTVGQIELQGCAAYATRELRYWTTERFFSYANVGHRDATDLTHRVALVLAQYNKVTEMEDILARLEDEYYAHNSFSNALQEVLNQELVRLDPPDHPLRAALFDCLDMAVTVHQADMEYVLSYVDSSCGIAPPLPTEYGT